MLATLAGFMVVATWMSNSGKEPIMNGEIIPDVGLLSVEIKKPMVAVVPVKRNLTNKEINAKWKDTQMHRRKDLQQACSGLSNSSITQDYLFYHQKLLRNLLIDHKYKAIYCYIPKVACTNWKKLWLQMRNITFKSATEAHTKAAYTRMNLKKIKSSEFSFVMKKYKKFLIVRDPMERLVSAYRNKFENIRNESIFTKMGTDIKQHYRKWTDVTGNSTKVTFKEFVQFLLDSSIQGQDLNEHWKSYEGLCQPCTVKYDYIGRYSTLSSDSNHILRELGVPSKLQFPKFKPKSTSALVTQYLDQLHPQQKTELYRLYKRDAMLFNYPQFSIL